MCGYPTTPPFVPLRRRTPMAFTLFRFSRALLLSPVCPSLLPPSFYLSPSLLITPPPCLFRNSRPMGANKSKTPPKSHPAGSWRSRDTDSRITVGGKLEKGAKLKCIVRRVVGNYVSVCGKEREIKATRSLEATPALSALSFPLSLPGDKLKQTTRQGRQNDLDFADKYLNYEPALQGMSKSRKVRSEK